MAASSRPASTKAYSQDLSGGGGLSGDYSAGALFEFAASHEQVAAADVRDCLDSEAVTHHDLGQTLAREVGDVLVLVAARHQQAVDRLDRSPDPGGVVGSAEEHESARLQYAANLVEDYFVVRQMLDNFLRDQAIEALVGKRQGESGAAYQRHPVAAEKAQLAQIEVHPDGVVEALDDE